MKSLIFVIVMFINGDVEVVENTETPSMEECQKLGRSIYGLQSTGWKCVPVLEEDEPISEAELASISNH